jgi:hypothetical protein
MWQGLNQMPISCGSSHMIIKINPWLWAFGVLWSPSFVLGLPSRGGFRKYSKCPWNMIHTMPCRNPCRLYIRLAFHINRWSLKRSVKRTWTGFAFSTNESAWSVMVMGSQCRVWSGPNALLKIVHFDCVLFPSCLAMTNKWKLSFDHHVQRF